MSNISKNTEREEEYDDDDLEYVLETSQGEPIKDANTSKTLSVDKQEDNSKRDPILMGTPTPNPPSSNSTGKNEIPVTAAPQVKHATAAAASKSVNQQPKFTSQIREKELCGLYQARKGIPCKERGQVCKKKCPMWVSLVKIVLIVAGLSYAYCEWTELKGQNSALSEKTKLQQLHLAERTQKIVDLQEQVERLKKKNAMLLQMADKVVEEEKRNCDFFDVFSIFTSTIGSKKERNLQELCLSYYRYSELESQVNNNPSNASNSQQQQVLEPLADDLTAEKPSLDLTATLNAHVETIQSVFSSFVNRIKETVQEIPLLIQSKEGDEQPSSEQPKGEEEAAAAEGKQESL